MKITKNASLLPFNTFGIDAKTNYLIEYDSVEDLKNVLELDIAKSNKILHVGSGSNLLFLKDFDGIILHSQLKYIEKVGENETSIFVEVGAGVVWDNFVSHCVTNNWGGIENLSHIPGETGASAVQNIGAYGVEVQDVIEKVNTVCMKDGSTRTFLNAECNYGYRKSIFKDELKGQNIVTSVIFRLDKTPVFKLNYQNLEKELLKYSDVNLNTIRQTIIEVRESKLPDTKVLGNAGSFFMNPIVSKQHFHTLQLTHPQIPHYFVSEFEEKVPAGWLIDQCGWKGKQIGNAGVHDKQALVLVNKGGATGAEIVYLAEQIQASVQEKFGINLQPEVNYIDSM